jgi:hypothetical protein
MAFNSFLVMLRMEDFLSKHVLTDSEETVYEGLEFFSSETTLQPRYGICCGTSQNFHRPWAWNLGGRSGPYQRNQSSNRVGISPSHLRAGTDPVSKTLCSLVSFRIPNDGQSPKIQ